jgi:hypothetical protein
MLYASITYAWQQQHPEIWWIIIIMLLGVLACVYNPPAKET